MQLAWQYIIVASVVFAAAAYIGRKVWLKVTRSESAGHCGAGCGSCGQKSATEQTDVIPLESLTTSIDALKPPRN